MKYNNQILEYFYHPKNVGRFNVTKNILVGTAGTKENGEIIELQILVENNVIKDSKFLAHGGVVVMASMEWITAWLKGKTIVEATKITAEEVTEALAVPATKKHAVLLAIEAVRTAINLLPQNWT